MRSRILEWDEGRTHAESLFLHCTKQRASALHGRRDYGQWDENQLQRQAWERLDRYMDMARR